jgi:hypothetical protein
MKKIEKIRTKCCNNYEVERIIAHYYKSKGFPLITNAHRRDGTSVLPLRLKLVECFFTAPTTDSTISPVSEKISALDALVP